MAEQLTEFNPFELMDTQEEINEFIGIIGSIEELIESDDMEKKVVLGIDPKYALVGFNKEWDDDEDWVDNENQDGSKDQDEELDWDDNEDK